MPARLDPHDAVAEPSPAAGAARSRVATPDAGPPRERFGELVGGSPSMRVLYDELARVAASEASVFIVGESGTGKDLVARALHRASGRAAAPFIAVNCGAIPDNLLEAELFGHEKGSFTGAHQQHAGYFERASGGTLFLDEVTEMGPDMQTRLLRVLETGRFYRVGGSVQVTVDLRVIAATNKDPAAAIRAGSFRTDLFYRLAVFPVRVPALRERDDDRLVLAQHFLDELNRRHGTAKRFSRGGLQVLASHAWPGNVRELRNRVQRGFILADHDVDLTDPASRPARRPSRHPGRVDLWVGIALADAQRELVLATLDHFDGDKPKAAEVLGISLKTLYNRLGQYAPGDADADGTAATTFPRVDAGPCTP